MIENERTKYLEACLIYWEESLARAKEQLSNLQRADGIGVSVIDSSGKNVLALRISQEIYACDIYSIGLARAKDQLSRARNGENV